MTPSPAEIHRVRASLDCGELTAVRVLQTKATATSLYQRDRIRRLGEAYRQLGVK